MKKTLLVIALAITAAVAALLVVTPPGRAQGGPPKFRHVQDAVPNQYIVVLTPLGHGTVSATAQSLVNAYGGQVRFVFEHAFRGFSVTTSEASAILISQDARVDFVEENGAVTISTHQPNAPWGLDRVDQFSLPLSTTYNYWDTGIGVHAYVLDTGIRPTHQDFAPAGRAVSAADYSPSGARRWGCG
jgi:aqualysin 1